MDLTLTFGNSIFLAQIKTFILEFKLAFRFLFNRFFLHLLQLNIVHVLMLWDNKSMHQMGANGNDKCYYRRMTYKVFMILLDDKSSDIINTASLTL